MPDNITESTIMVAPRNGKLVTWAMLAVIAAAALTLASATLWAADRFGSVESRVSVLEAHYGHIADTLERIERKVDEGM